MGKAAAAALDRRSGAVASKDLLRLSGADPDHGDEAQRRQHEAAVLTAMLELARSADVHERKLAYAALSDFPTSAAAVEVLSVGQQDPDSECQMIASKSFHEVMRKLATTRP